MKKSTAEIFVVPEDVTTWKLPVSATIWNVRVLLRWLLSQGNYATRRNNL